MSDFSDFCAQIADFENRQDWSPVFITSLVRMAESKFNAELRIDRMITSSQALIAGNCAPLPDDWLESDFMLIANSGAPTGWVPIRYKPRDQFFVEPNTTYSNYYLSGLQNTTYGYYTIEGRQIYFGGPVDDINGTTFQLNYYAEVPIFSDINDSWLYTKYPSMYLSAAQIYAKLHAVGEEDKAAQTKQFVEDQIQKLNAQHRYARASGSRLARGHRRSFG